MDDLDDLLDSPKKDVFKKFDDIDLNKKERKNNEWD